MTSPPNAARAEALSTLRSWIEAVRPRSGGPATDQISKALARLSTDPTARQRLSDAVHHLLSATPSADDLASLGILSEAPLHQALGQRLVERALPPLSDDTRLHHLVGSLFHHPGDVDWLTAVPPAQWSQLATLLGLTVDPGTPIPEDLSLAIRVLAHRIAALGLRPALTSRVPELGTADSPFLALSDRSLAYIRSHGHGEIGEEGALLDDCQGVLRRCRQAVDHLRANKNRYGTSLELTALSARMLGLIERLELLLALTDPRTPDLGHEHRRLLVTLVKAERRSGNIGALLRQHGDLLVLQVVDRAAKKGHSYITTTWAEYRKFLLSSLGGGLIVALFAAGKIGLGGLKLPLAGQALVYSLNYALCFVLIYLTGATLATKQPAVTAHTLAASLDGPANTHHPRRLAERIAQAWRSQFISFVGNLAMAFPVGLLIAVGWRVAYGEPLASHVKATRLLTDVHPWQGAALWYAAIAGVFLFFGGVVSGWIDNRMVYNRVSARIASSPRLVRRLGASGAARLASAIDGKAGAMAGNVFLGFCLGSAGVVGHIVGLPIDIRHIAFSSAHLAMALDGLDWAVSAPHFMALFAGVALIGFVNFLVSFGLALLLAIESRQLKFNEGRELLGHLLRRVRHHPSDFFYPPRSPRRPAGSSDSSTRSPNTQ